MTDPVIHNPSGSLEPAYFDGEPYEPVRVTSEDGREWDVWPALPHRIPRPSQDEADST